MKPPRFHYHRPARLDEALTLLRALPDAKILAGGQSLIPMLNFRLARPQHLVDLGGLSELADIREENGHLAIGAMTRQARVERDAGVRARCPVLGAALAYVGHYAIRTRGTIGGNLAHADPSSELPVVATVLGAEFVSASASGRRVLPASEFFRGPLTVALEADEVLVEVRFPVLEPRAGWAFVELSRRHGDFAIVCACAVISLDGEGRCVSAALGLGGVAGAPVRCRQAEAILIGRRPDSGSLQNAAASVVDEVDPDEDLHASADYRRAMAVVYAGQALEAACARATRER